MNILKRIPKMGLLELFEFVISNPEYLSDRYYRDICDAIWKQYHILANKHGNNNECN